MGYKVKNIPVKIYKRTDEPKVGNSFKVNFKMFLIFIKVLFD